MTSALLLPFGLLASSWQFARRQWPLFHVTAWLLVVPLLVIQSLDRFAAGWTMPENSSAAALLLLWVLATMLFGVCLLWGIACVLVVARRLVQSAAGRSRTSFKAIRREGMLYVIPLLLTSVLHGVIAFILASPFLWIMSRGVEPRSLVLVLIPLYFILKTAFFRVVIVVNGKYGIAALRESWRTMDAKFWRASWELVVITVICIGLPRFATSLLERTLDKTPLLPLVDALTAILLGCGLMLHLLATTKLYAHLKKKGAREVTPA